MSRAQSPRRGAIGGRAGRLRVWASRLAALRSGALRLAALRLGMGRSARAAAAGRLYRDLVVQARSPFFYRELGVPDTPEGRFEMIGLHAALILLRLRAGGVAGQALGQALFDLMIADLDQSLRELGVGDLGVGKQVKRLAGQFYARLRALDELIGSGEARGGGAAGDRGATGRLGEVLRVNVWHGGRAPGAGQVEALADYLVRSARRLGGQSADLLLNGEAAFALPAGGRSARRAARRSARRAARRSARRAAQGSARRSSPMIAASGPGSAGESHKKFVESFCVERCS